MSSSGAAARDGRLKVGMRILEVNHQSLLGMTHTEAVQILRSVGDTLLVLVCDGFDPKAAAAIEVKSEVHGALVVTSTARIPPILQRRLLDFPAFRCRFFLEFPHFEVWSPAV